MNNNQLFEWVKITQEADLPGESGDYTVRVEFKDGTTNVHEIGWMPGWDWHNEDGYVSAYLRSYSPKPVRSAEEIEKEAMKDIPFVWPKNKDGEDMVKPVGHVNPPFWEKYKQSLKPYIAGYTKAMNTYALSQPTQEDVAGMAKTACEFAKWLLNSFDMIFDGQKWNWKDNINDEILTTYEAYTQYLKSLNHK